MRELTAKEVKEVVGGDITIYLTIVTSCDGTIYVVGDIIVIPHPYISVARDVHIDGGECESL